MKRYILSSVAVLLYCTAFANHAPANVILTGKVSCNESKRPIASSVVVSAEGQKSIQIEVAANGKFSALLPSAHAVKIQVEADGYESRESVFQIPHNTHDTTLFVEIFMIPRYEVILSGNILDAKTNKPIAAEFDLYLDSDIIKEDVQIIHDGKFKEIVSKPGWYIMDILSPGYLTLSDTMWLVHEGTRSLHRDYHLTPIEVGLNVVIDNVYFYFGQTILKPESSGALDKIVAFIKANPTIELEIAGHTDDEGADDYNLTLSQGRAEAIVQYLVKVGVDPSKLTAHGYGETKPLDHAITKAAKARNRRVEFTVLKK